MFIEITELEPTHILISQTKHSSFCHLHLNQSNDIKPVVNVWFFITLALSAEAPALQQHQCCVAPPGIGHRDYSGQSRVKPISTIWSPSIFDGPEGSMQRRDEQRDPAPFSLLITDVRRRRREEEQRTDTELLNVNPLFFFNS